MLPRIILRNRGLVAVVCIGFATLLSIGILLWIRSTKTLQYHDFARSRLPDRAIIQHEFIEGEGRDAVGWYLISFDKDVLAEFVSSLNLIADDGDKMGYFVSAPEWWPQTPASGHYWGEVLGAVCYVEQWESSDSEGILFGILFIGY